MMNAVVKSFFASLCGILLFGAADPVNSDITNAEVNVPESYFEGRWAFEEETCELPTNWTMLAGGNFISQDLTGTWAWQGGKLILNLTDLAIDEETGETGGRFEMEGLVQNLVPGSFTLIVEPDSYRMKRCL